MVNIIWYFVNNKIKFSYVNGCKYANKSAFSSKKIQHNKNCSKQNLSNKLRKGTIRYDEMLVIADILGFEIKFEGKK